MKNASSKLKFKGGFNKYLKETHSKLKKEIREKKKQEYYEVFGEPKGERQMLEVTFPIEQGTGRIITSCATVDGKDTKFSKELKQFDTIIVLNPQTLVKEESQVSAILSDTSMSLIKPFENDLMSFTTFEYQRKQEIKEGDECIEAEYLDKFEKIGKKVKVMTPHEYRARKGVWSYHKIKENVEGDVTRENLLDRRIKKVRDKFCWF